MLKYLVKIIAISIFAYVSYYLFKSGEVTDISSGLPSTYFGWLGLWLFFVGAGAGFPASLKLRSSINKFNKLELMSLANDCLFYASSTFFGVLAYLYFQ